MITGLLFLCAGFIIAVLCIDLVFDASGWSHRRASSLPPAVLDPIATYYRHITRRPYLLMLMMLLVTGCTVVQIVYELIPRIVGYASLTAIALGSLFSVLEVIPTAQRLGAHRDPVERQSLLARRLLPYHAALVVQMLALVGVQFAAMAA